MAFKITGEKLKISFLRLTPVPFRSLCSFSLFLSSNFPFSHSFSFRLSFLLSSFRLFPSSLPFSLHPSSFLLFPSLSCSFLHLFLPPSCPPPSLLIPSLPTTFLSLPIHLSSPFSVVSSSSLFPPRTFPSSFLSPLFLRFPSPLLLLP